MARNRYGRSTTVSGVRLSSSSSRESRRPPARRISYAPGDIDDLTVLEFDPGSFVLTAFGRHNAGTIRGDRAVADRFLNVFFRI